jgi:phosphoribosylformimino-5-aminoimidazole carboxamide ribotide isomerase
VFSPTCNHLTQIASRRTCYAGELCRRLRSRRVYRVAAIQTPAPHSSDFVVFPAIHLKGGRAFDFTENADTDSAIPDLPEPIACAQYWLEQGAKWIHVINVDAAHDEDASHNWPLVEKICELPINVQYGGGIRTPEDIEWAVRIGVTRILLNTAAVENPVLVAEAVAEYGSERFGLLVNTDPAGEMMTRGWRMSGGLLAVTLGVQMYQLGITTAVHSRVLPDGTMSGTDLDVSKEFAQLTGMNVIVGGEVRDMDDLVQCYNQQGISGALIGKALHTGKIDLKRALRTTSSKIAFESALPQWKEEQQSLKAHIRYELSMQNLFDHLPQREPMRTLDAGGGNGIDSLRLARMNYPIDLVDTSTSMLHDLHETMQKNATGISITTHSFDIREIHKKFAANSFDLLLCHNVIQYSDDWEELLDSMLAPLANGGYFSLITRNKHAVPYDAAIDDYELDELPALLDEPHGKSGVFDADISFFTTQFLSRWLESRGLRIVADYGVFCLYNHYSVVARYDQLSPTDKLETLERHLGKQSPYKDTARYIQIIAQK